MLWIKRQQISKFRTPQRTHFIDVCLQINSQIQSDSQGYLKVKRTLFPGMLIFSSLNNL